MSSCWSQRGAVVSAGNTYALNSEAGMGMAAIHCTVIPLMSFGSLAFAQERDTAAAVAWALLRLCQRVCNSAIATGIAGIVPTVFCSITAPFTVAMSDNAGVVTVCRYLDSARRQSIGFTQLIVCSIDFGFRIHRRSRLQHLLILNVRLAYLQLSF